MENKEADLTSIAELARLVADSRSSAKAGTLELLELFNITEKLGVIGLMHESLALYDLWLANTRSPLKYVAYFNQGVTLAAAGNHMAAEQSYRNALTLRPDMIQASLNLGASLEHQGRLEEAVVQWRQSLVVESLRQPENLGLRLFALNNLGRVLLTLNNESAARAFFEESIAFEPDQPAIRAQLEQLRDEALVDVEPPEKTDDPIIYVLACCYNEAAILPFFLDHYTNYVGAQKIFLYDGGSTDGSDQIAKDYPVEFIVEKHDKLDDSILMRIRNEEWKKHRDACDWFVVCDVDEFLYHPDLKNKLHEYKKNGVTLPMVEGFEMYSKVFPRFEKGTYIHQLIQSGTANPSFYNKNLIFDPKIEINYTMGCHRCLPTGPVKRSARFEFKNLHYKCLSFEYQTSKARKSNERLSDWNKQNGAGIHYQWLVDQEKHEFLQRCKGADNVLNPVAAPKIVRDGFEPAFNALLTMERDVVIAEFGTQRYYDGTLDGGGSTQLFAWYVNRYGGIFYSVDADRLNIDNGRRELKKRRLSGSRVHLVHEDAADFLGKLDCSVDCVFLNARDYRGDDAALRRYEENLLLTFKGLEPLLSDNSIILIDGITNQPAGGGYARFLVEYLLSNNYLLIKDTYQLLFKK